MMRRLVPYARALGAALPLADSPAAPWHDVPVASPAPLPLPFPAASPLAKPGQAPSRAVTLQFIPARPTLPEGSRIAGQYDGGVLALCCQPPLEVSVDNAWGPAFTAKIAAARVGQAETACVEGWLTMHEVPVLSLRWLPRSWWDDHHSGPALIGRIWQAIAPPSQRATGATPETVGPTPPDRLEFTGEVRDGALQLHAAASWTAPDGDAQVAQALSLSAAGDCTPGAGKLAWTGSLPALSRFVDRQLLPLLGEAPVRHAPAASAPSLPLRASATWDVRAEGLQLRAHLRHPHWLLQGVFVQDEAGSRFALGFQGNPAQFGQAAQPMRLPRLCQIDDIAAWVANSRDLASGWSRSERAWEAAHATLRAQGEVTRARGVEGTAHLLYRHGTWIDSLHGRIGPAQPGPRTPLPHLIDEAGPLELAPHAPERPPLHLLHGIAAFFSGGHLRVGSDSLRAFGAWAPAADVHLDLRRYTVPRPAATASFWHMSSSALGSLMSLRRPGAPALAPVSEPASAPNVLTASP